MIKLIDIFIFRKEVYLVDGENMLFKTVHAEFILRMLLYL